MCWAASTKAAHRKASFRPPGPCPRPPPADRSPPTRPGSRAVDETRLAPSRKPMPGTHPVRAHPRSRSVSAESAAPWIPALAPATADLPLPRAPRTVACNRTTPSSFVLPAAPRREHGGTARVPGRRATDRRSGSRKRRWCSQSATEPPGWSPASTRIWRSPRRPAVEDHGDGHVPRHFSEPSPRGAVLSCQGC